MNKKAKEKITDFFKEIIMCDNMQMYENIYIDSI